MGCGTRGPSARRLPRQAPPCRVGSAPGPRTGNEKMQTLPVHGTCGLLPPASLLLRAGLLLMNGWGGWRIVTFPVADFQESPRLLSSLQSCMSFQADCKERWNSAACRSWCSRAGADRGLDGLDVRQMHTPLPGLEGDPCLTSSGNSFRVL